MIHTLSELAARLGKGQRLLGLDVGSTTVGLAVSDPGLVVASPIHTLKRTKFTQDARELGKTVRDYAIGGLIVGLPLNMDGTEGPRAESVRAFAKNLLERADLLGWNAEIAFWDERLSTSAVERFMIGEADMTRKRRDEVVDKMAAAYILQGALDMLANQRRQEAGPVEEQKDEDGEEEWVWVPPDQR
ncbi:Holliday junction resolvase RuvX [Azospirillum doebereinerae]|uniref:Putative pre-16S rRNA nuclease n=1 Tax=Azospirillum doebereinerae TaxID=92933 RepID=A0A3S0X9B8_9PROT|nr:Holliday junction resolvase RuvX [Azospirillum doebereinerae]MCG5240824.1 Holliday junction resolvase RuvX [Azospirillum doebereinerae]RUQ67501.1 Holliday junction resolvase RuvX [Azospirillum doebereinerae]